jgi:hypothetical protein
MEHRTWRKSSYSSDDGNCVEVANLDGQLAVRDSKNPTTTVLTVTAAQWAAFTTEVKDEQLS